MLKLKLIHVSKMGPWYPFHHKANRYHNPTLIKSYHYNDIIMTTVASQITSLTVVCSTVYSDTDQRKYQSSASLAFVWGIRRDRWIPRTNGQLRGKYFMFYTLWINMVSGNCHKKAIQQKKLVTMSNRKLTDILLYYKDWKASINGEKGVRLVMG